MRALPAIVLQPEETHASGAYALPTEALSTANSRAKDVLLNLYDPTRLWVPEECVQKVDNVYEDPIVRAGTTHSEALVEFLRSPQAAGATVPPGFGSAPGDKEGLPKWLDTVPGVGLDQARNIFDSLQQRPGQTPNHLGKTQALPRTTGWLTNGAPNLNVIFQEILPAQRAAIGADVTDQWLKAYSNRFDVEMTLGLEEEKIKEEGLPYSLDTQDFFDLEGREYRRRMKQSQDWNRPPFQPMLTLEQNGKLKSLAAIRSEVLRDQARVPDPTGFEEVVGKKRRYWR